MQHHRGMGAPMRTPHAKERACTPHGKGAPMRTTPNTQCAKGEGAVLIPACKASSPTRLVDEPLDGRWVPIPGRKVERCLVLVVQLVQQRGWRCSAAVCCRLSVFQERFQDVNTAAASSDVPHGVVAAEEVVAQQCRVQPHPRPDPANVFGADGVVKAMHVRLRARRHGAPHGRAPPLGLAGSGRCRGALARDGHTDGAKSRSRPGVWGGSDGEIT